MAGPPSGVIIALPQKRLPSALRRQPSRLRPLSSASRSPSATRSVVVPPAG